LRARWLVLPAILAALLTAGALGAPFHRDEVPFESVERNHFDAIAVNPDQGPPSQAPLDLRVHVLGDGADADLSPAFRWLTQHANVRVTQAGDGAPLFLTRGDLSATSGRATLGATISSGVAAEVGDARIGPCVVAHEILHLLGLGHVDDPDNIMYPHCSPGMLDHAKLEAWQLAKLQSLEDIHATTPRGVETWVTRG
jgi:hypothetical protein